MKTVAAADAAPGVSPSPPAPLQGQKYQVSEVHAQGGMGAVLRATDLKIDRTVAMKVILPEKQASKDLLRRFLQEARLTGQLEHPNIVPVHELGTNDTGQAFYTMKFVKGKTLKALLQEPLAEYSLPRLLTIFQKVCDAVAFAHSRGVVHRDLKPENVMIGEYGEVMVMDWGLAKPLGTKEAEALTVTSETGTSLQTMAGQIMGTPQFMAPEQAAGRIDQIDERTDIYSLGAILYNLLALQPPFTGENAREVLAQVRVGHIAPPQVIRADVPESLAAVAMQALALNPTDRYPAVRELQKEIEAYQAGYATTAEHASIGKLIWLWVKRHKIETAAAMASTAILLAMATVFVVRVTVEKNRVLAERNRAERALSDLRAAAPTYYGEAKSLIDQGRFDEALDKATYAVSLMPDVADYQALRGNILESLLRIADAATAYEAALASNPDHRLAKENLQLCQALLSTNRTSPDAEKYLVTKLQAAMKQQGRAAEARTIVLHLGSEGSGFDEVWKMLSRSGLTPVLQNASQRVVVNKDGSIKLDFSKSEIVDLMPLKGMPLVDLNLRSTAVTDLQPLQGMKLTKLNIGHSQVKDLTPLHDMPLKDLRVYGAPVSDLRPLLGMSVEFLSLSGCPVTDLTPLRGLPVKKLLLDGCTKVVDLSPLTGCTQLTELVLPPGCKDVERLRGHTSLKRLSYRKSAGIVPRPAQTTTEFWKEYDAKRASGQSPAPIVTEPPATPDEPTDPETEN